VGGKEMPSDPIDNHKSIVPRAYQGLGIYARPGPVARGPARAA
jgi:hypothetical protein